MIKKIISLLLLIFLVVSVSAQRDVKKSSQKDKDKKKETAISQEIRKESSLYADGLREFYSYNFNAAELTFRKVINQNPKNDAAYFMLAKISSEKKDYFSASNYLQEALKIDKNNEWYKIDLAIAYDNIGDYKNSVKLWEEICKLKYDNEYYHISLANAYLQLNKLVEAIKVYDKIETIIGKIDELTERKKEIWLYLNNVKNAVGEYDKMIEIYPYEINYYLEAGNIYMANEMMDKAFTYLQKAQALEPNNGRLNIILSEYYLRTKRSEESFKSLLAVSLSSDLSIEEKLPALRNPIINALRLKDNASIKKAEILLDVITKVHPEDENGWAYLAKMKMLTGDNASAKPLFAKAIAINPASYNLWEDYISVLYELKEYKEITKDAETITEYFPTNGMLLYLLGEAFKKEQEYNEALKYFKQATSYTFESELLAQIYDATGDVYLDINNKEEAVKFWKMAQKKGMNTQELKDKINNNE